MRARGDVRFGDRGSVLLECDGSVFRYPSLEFTMRDKYENHLEVALTSLESARSVLNAEIADYPTPISGCDVQFNRLLSDRTRVEVAIQALQSQPFIPTPRRMEPGAAMESR